MGCPDHKAASTSGALMSSKAQARAHSPRPEEGPRHSRPSLSSTLVLQPRCGRGGGCSWCPPCLPTVPQGGQTPHQQSVPQPTLLASHSTPQPTPNCQPRPPSIIPVHLVSSLLPSRPGLSGLGQRAIPPRAQAENRAHSWKGTSIPRLPLHLRSEG